MSIAKAIGAALLFVLDALIRIMLLTRKDERTIQSTKRVSWRKGWKEELGRRQDRRCMYCGVRKLLVNFHIDHKIPVVRGGSNDMGNLQLLCRSCNLRKGNQTDEEFRNRYRSVLRSDSSAPPTQAISESEFKKVTRETQVSDSVKEFNRTKFISPRAKIVSGSVLAGAICWMVCLVGLLEIVPALEGAAMPISLVLGIALSLGLIVRAHSTGKLTSA